MRNKTTLGADENRAALAARDAKRKDARRKHTPELGEAAWVWRKAAAAEKRTRSERDSAIRDARKAGQGVREIGRETGLDPTQVSRVLRRGGA